MGSVVSFLRRVVSRGWSTQELAEFYRVESALVQSGLSISSGQGMSDEGDPWFVFCRAEDDEVIVHFARCDGRYLISAPSFGADVTGGDFNLLVRGLLERQPVAARSVPQRDNIRWHPSALLVMLVATALFKSGHAADASQTGPSDPAGSVSDSAQARVNSVLDEHMSSDMAQVTLQNVAMLTAVSLVLGQSVWAPEAFTAGLAGPAESEIPSYSVAPATFALTQEPDAHHPNAGSASVDVVMNASVPSSGAGDTPLPIHADASAVAWSAPVQSVDHGSMAIVVAPLDDPGPIAKADMGYQAALAPHVSALLASHDLAEFVVGFLSDSPTVQYVTTLPAALDVVLHASLHASAIIAPIDSTTATGPVIAGLNAATGVGINSAPGVGIGSASGNATANTGQSAFSGDHAASGGGTGLKVSLNTVTELSQVVVFQQNFVKEVGANLFVYVTDTQVVEVDRYALAHAPSEISSVTFDLADGSHISLVGLPNELLHAQT